MPTPLKTRGPRSSERPATSRDHWAVGRPLVRSCDSCSIACRCNSVDVTGERSDERRHLPVALEPAEAAFRVEHPGGTLAFDHLAVAPPLHIPGRVARDRDHALDAVRVREARGEPAADTEPPDGEHVLEAFAQARRRIGPARLELRGQVPTGTFTLRGIVVVERGGELATDPGALPCQFPCRCASLACFGPPILAVISAVIISPSRPGRPWCTSPTALTRDARDRAQRQAQLLRQLHRLGRFVAIDQTDSSYVLFHRWWSPSVVG